MISTSIIIGCTFHEDYYVNRGNLKISQGKYDLAMEYYNFAIKNDPKNPKAFLGRGVVWLIKKDYQAAIVDFTQAINLKSNYSEAYFNRATAWVGEGNADKALIDCNMGLKIASRNNETYIQDNDQIHLLNAKIWYIKKDYEKVSSQLLKAIGLNPQNEEALNKYAWLLATCPDEKYRDGKKAFFFAQKAIRFSSIPENLDTLAAVYAEQFKFPDAIVTQEKAINLIDDGNNEMMMDFKKRLQSYKNGKAWRTEF